MKEVMFIIIHNDATLTLVEQTEKVRTFTPVNTMSHMVQFLSQKKADVPLENIITENCPNGWVKQLNERCREIRNAQ